MRTRVKIFIFLLIPVQIYSQVNGWEEQNSYVEVDLHEVFALDSMHAWALGTEQTIIMTSDGGINWSNSSMPVTASCIHFFDTLKGIATGGSTIMITNDGGYSWSTYPTGLEVTLTDMSFVDTLNGWIIGNPDEVILRTQDGGLSWQSFDLGIDGIDLTEVGFSDHENGWILGWESIGSNDKMHHLLHTDDGGDLWYIQNTWAQTSSIGFRIRDLCVVDSLNLWVGGLKYNYNYDPDMGVVINSGDGGQGWEINFYIDYFYCHKIHFPDLNHGWAIDIFKIIYLDLPYNPVVQYQSSGPNMKELYFADSLNGWVVGDSGLVLHTYTGGLVGTNDLIDGQSTTVNIYPNPSTKYLHCELQDNFKNLNIIIFDIYGTKVLETKISEPEKLLYIDVEGLPAGMYMLNISDHNDFNANKKLIKR